MVTLHFEEENCVIPVNYLLLKEIAAHLPDNRQSGGLILALMRMDIPSINTQLAGKDCLDTAQRDALWDTGDKDVRRALVGNTSFLNVLTDAQAQAIMDMDDREMLLTVARFAEMLFPARGEKYALRLSGAKADALLDHMIHHKNLEVRRELAENPDVPLKFCVSVMEHLNIGAHSWNMPLAFLTEEDIPALMQTDRKNLCYLANNIEDVENIALRQRVAHLLAEYADPEVRLALAANTSAPHEILQALLQDNEPDVAIAAQRNIEGEEEFADI